MDLLHYGHHSSDRFRPMLQINRLEVFVAMAGKYISYLTSIKRIQITLVFLLSTNINISLLLQIGAISVTMSWLNLLSTLRKFPFLGIYVVMFTDVLQTFLKFALIILLFIIAFSLGFHALIGEQVNIIGELINFHIDFFLALEFYKQCD